MTAPCFICEKKPKKICPTTNTIQTKFQNFTFFRLLKIDFCFEHILTKMHESSLFFVKNDPKNNHYKIPIQKKSIFHISASQWTIFEKTEKMKWGT